MLSLITNERNPDRLAGFPYGMNAQGCCRGGFGGFFYFSPPPSLNIFICLKVSLLLIKYLFWQCMLIWERVWDQGQIWEGAVECWIPGGSAMRWEPQLGNLCSDSISVYAEWIKTSRRTGGTPWQLAPGWLALFSLMCSRASSLFLTLWMGVWAVGPLAAFSFF